MGLYKHIKNAWKKPKQLGKAYTQKLIEFRREPATIKIKKPTRIDRARSLGYKAKQGIIVVRQKVSRGGHKNPKGRGGKRPKRASPRMTLEKNYRAIAEQRANKKYKNCEVLNSYPVAKDGKSYWFEVILIDRGHPAAKKDKNLKGIAKQKARAYRGKTSASRKSRGLRKKGKGAEKIRPSRKANVSIRRKPKKS